MLLLRTMLCLYLISIKKDKFLEELRTDLADRSRDKINDKYFLSIPKYINGNTMRQCGLCYGLPNRYIYRLIPNIFLTTLQMNKYQRVYLSSKKGMNKASKSF